MTTSLLPSWENSGMKLNRPVLGSTSRLRCGKSTVIVAPGSVVPLMEGMCMAAFSSAVAAAYFSAEIGS